MTPFLVIISNNDNPDACQPNRNLTCQQIVFINSFIESHHNCSLSMSSDANKTDIDPAFVSLIIVHSMFILEISVKSII